MKTVPRRPSYSLKIKAKDQLKFVTDSYKAREKLGDVFKCRWGKSPNIHGPFPANQRGGR